MLWHEQNWPRIESLDKNIPVVIPLGSCEQHGRHLPLFVDSMQVTAIAEAVHAKMQDKILLTPTLWIGSSHHHQDYPGTISLPPALYSQVIDHIARSVLRAGFKKILFLNGHGGNDIPGSQALGELVTQLDDADAATLAFSSWWRLSDKAIAADKHGMETKGINHACEYETSLMLFLRNDLVKLDAIDLKLPFSKAAWQSGQPWNGRVSVFHRFHRLTASGHVGKPEVATAEKGESLFGAIVSEITTFLIDFATWPTMPALGPK